MGGGDNLQCCYREQLGYALYAKFREPKLFRMTVTGDWDKIPARCRTHPKEASFVHKYPPSDTALHRLLRPVGDCMELLLDEGTASQMNQMKLAAVGALLEANRQAASTADSFGRTPLHLACMDVNQGGGCDAASMILDVNPLAATVVDLEKRTPLHFLLARNNGIPLDLLQKLLKQSPAAVFQQDVVGDTPVDIVEQRKDEIENATQVLAILRAVPDPQGESAKSSQQNVGNK